MNKKVAVNAIINALIGAGSNDFNRSEKPLEADGELGDQLKNALGDIDVMLRTGNSQAILEAAEAVKAANKSGVKMDVHTSFDELYDKLAALTD